VGVLAVQGKALDLDYLAGRAKGLAVEGLLERALAEVATYS